MITWTFRRTETGTYEVGHVDVSGRWQAEAHEHSDRFTAAARARRLNQIEVESCRRGRTPALPYEEAA